MSLEIIVEGIKNLIYSWGYLGIFIGTFSESFLAPIPSEPLMGLAGFLISEGKLSWFGVIFAAVLGNLTSSSIIWFLGNKYGEPFLFKYGKYIGYSKNDFLKSEKLFAKYGYFIVFICQLLPLMRSLISIPAGVLKTKLIPFLIATGLGCTIWLSFLTYLGYSLGQHWETIGEYIKPYERPLSLIIIIAIFVLIVKQAISAYKNFKIIEAEE